jgi:hypothetical protein
MSKQEFEQEKKDSTSESTYGGVTRCLSYDRYVKRLEKKKKGSKKKKIFWILAAIGIAALAAIGVCLLVF